MLRPKFQSIAWASVLLLGVPTLAADAAGDLIDTVNNKQSILELMISRVTPATNILWGVGDPQTKAEWQALEDAASETIEVFTLLKLGGSGKNDNDWATNKDWQVLSDDAITAAKAAKLAIAERDLEALLEAGDGIYEPCETCHKAYNPGVARP